MNRGAPLEVSHISKSFDDRPVLNDVSLALTEGEIFGLIGLNGIGKTTLIKIILDLLKPDAGDAKLFGLPSSSVASRRNLSYLPEKFQPSRYLKGKEYLALSLSFYGKKYDHAQAEEQAKLLDLRPDALEKLVGSYSKGMGQKLGLLGAFMVGTPLLLLDEPMSGLDPRARILLKEKITSLKKEGRTVFFSSHILSDIDEICDRIGVLHNGELLFVGTPKEFKKSRNIEALEPAFLDAITAKEAA